MITVIVGNHNFILQPTIFPDGTSQVWKLPQDILQCSSVSIDWRFESEREIIDLLSLRKLIKHQNVSLHVPYLPYARQDKDVTNESTFNLVVFADLINSMNFTTVSSVDAHNAKRTAKLIKRFINIPASDFHSDVIESSEPDFIVFPDKGAADRYHDSGTAHIPKVVCDKTRNQLTGAITGHEIVEGNPFNRTDLFNTKFLIIDDLCDGGATFVSVAKLLKSANTPVYVDLCVTHGLFSKGRDHLLANGIDKLYTTNSLTKNEDGYKV
jgi:ribose-phosphate pyrophosphokinase